MNPYKLREVYKQLTSQNSILKKYLKLGTKDIKQPDLPAFVETKNAVNRFMRDNPRPDQLGRKDMAGGGMLVQPSVDGSRPGYATSKVKTKKFKYPFSNQHGTFYSDTPVNMTRRDFKKSPQKIKAPTKKQLEITEKVYSKKYGKTGIDLWESLKQSERSNIRQGQVTGEPVVKLKKNQIGKDDFIKLVKANKDKTYNEFVEILKDYKTKDNKPFTKNIVADRLRDYGLSGTFKKEPPKGSDPTKKAQAEKKRKDFLKETEPTKAKGTVKYPFHHITQIAGGVPLTSDDVAIINQRMNSVMSKYDQDLNRIAEAIQKNNRLALEAMNAKDESSALKYMSRVDELNQAAEKIVNSAIEKLPKKYKGLVGFTQFSLPTDEYGLPISNEPMVTRKIGGVPISKNAIDLTNLTLEQEKIFRNIVKDQAKAGKTGKINLEPLLEKIGCPGLASGGRAGFDVGTNCQIKGANLINSGMKNATPAQLKNFAAFANRARALGRGVMKFGVIPEAMYVAADATIRLTMGDKPIEALLRASEYLLPGDQTKLAEMMEATRLSSPETAAIIGRSIDYKNQLAKIQSLEDTRANLENLSGGGEFDYIGDLNQDVKNLDNQIKQATDALNTTFKMTDAEQIYANRMQDEVDDIRKSRSLTTKLKSMFRDVDPDSDVETLGAPEVTQKQLNLRMAPQLPRDLLLAKENELIDYAKHQQSQGFDIPDNYYLQQQRDVKNMSLAELAAATSPEQIYGASGTMGEPLNKGVVEKPQNVISDMANEITGQTNVANPFDIDLSMIGSGLRGFSAAGGGIAKEGGVDSGAPPESGPNPQGLSYLMKRGKNT